MGDNIFDVTKGKSKEIQIKYIYGFGAKIIAKYETEKMGTIALAHDLCSRHPFLINFSKLLLGPEVSIYRELNCGLQAVYNGREAELRNIPEFLSDPP